MGRNGSPVTAPLRERGAVYTPAPVARYMVRSALDDWCAREAAGDWPARILDPGCGDGAFAVALLEELSRRPADRRGDARAVPSPCELVQERLFGVDIDAAAVRRLRQRIAALLEGSVADGFVTDGRVNDGPVTQDRVAQGRLNDLATDDSAASAVRRCLRRNFRVGDALTGRGFEVDSGTADPRAFDWRRAFPDVAAGGGFDLIIGNPPYLREKDAKRVFDRIAAAPLGQRWREPRMDLWHYFLHRGLDLLKPRGMLCFIVNSYWMKARSARPVIERLRRETTIREMVLLGDAPVFEGVRGRHMIFRLTRESTAGDCRVIDLTRAEDPLAVLTGPHGVPEESAQLRRQADVFAAAAAGREGVDGLSLIVDGACPVRTSIGPQPLSAQPSIDHQPSTINRPSSGVDGLSLIVDGACPVRTSIGPQPLSPQPSINHQPSTINRPSSGVDGLSLIVDGACPLEASINHQPSTINHPSSTLARLGDCYDVRQGIAENPPFVTTRMAADSGGELTAGAGVFVLTAEEVAALDLAGRERQLLRPYFRASSIGRFSVPDRPTHWLLYLTRQTAASLDAFPRVRAHLARFRETLERRREVRRGRIAWWHLHWPRRETLFTRPRILAVQMAREPTFAWAERPTFVGFSINLIQSREESPLPLAELAALLNSPPAAEWFARHAKQRGVGLDITGAVLRAFPLEGVRCASSVVRGPSSVARRHI